MSGQRRSGVSGPISSLSTGMPSSAALNLSPGASTAETREAVGLRFEQMLWAEMLSHAGLEKAMTLGGGEGASAFSRYVVESIAADLAEKQPLGMADAIRSATGDDGSISEGDG